MKQRVGTVVIALGLMVGFLPRVAAAQNIVARVTDAMTGEPLQGALVALTDPAGAPVRSALTNARGLYLFAGIAPGSYTLRGELIGYATWSGAVSVRPAATTAVDLRMESRAIELEGIRIEGEGRCELRPEAGLQVASVWDEVRKALEAARFTSEQGVYEYRTRSFARSIEDETGLVTDQQSRRGRVFLTSPYESRPAEDLIENGFIQDPADGGEGKLYFAPDASVLLSDLFLDTHCMRLREGDDETDGLVGLAFEPIRGRRLPDIAGTLWVDTATWELSHLEFRYDNTRRDVPTRGTGGEVRFQLLPNGTWIVPRWIIRMPLLAQGTDGRGQQTIYQFGSREVGAQVLSIREPAGEVIFSATTAALEGVVLDAGGGEPVAGAVVYLTGTEERVVADAEGRFRFTEMPPGRYDVAVTHPETESYGPAAPTVPAELEEGTVVSLRLYLTSAFAFHEAACAEAYETRPRDARILVGRVTDAGSGVGLEGAVVTIEWEEYGGDELRLTVQGRSLEVRTEGDGSYRACLVPQDRPLQVGAEWGPYESEGESVRIGPGDVGLVHDITIGFGQRTSIAGVVRGWTQGEPVREARVSIVPLRGGDAGAMGRTTDAAGRFSPAEVDVGEYVVEVSALGYATVRDTIVARVDRVNHMMVRLPEAAIEIEGVSVEVEARFEFLQDVGYYERRREGFGFRLDGDEIAPLLPIPVEQLLQGTPGVQLRSLAGQFGSKDAIVIGRCLPALYLDGVLVRRATPFEPNPNPSRTGIQTPDYLSDFVSARDIAGIEVFRSPAEIPAAYAGDESNCGLILVWTR